MRYLLLLCSLLVYGKEYVNARFGYQIEVPLGYLVEEYEGGQYIEVRHEKSDEGELFLLGFELTRSGCETIEQQIKTFSNEEREGLYHTIQGVFPEVQEFCISSWERPRKDTIAFSWSGQKSGVATGGEFILFLKECVLYECIYQQKDAAVARAIVEKIQGGKGHGKKSVTYR